MTTFFDFPRRFARFARCIESWRGVTVAAALFGALLPTARAATPLADQPLFATSSAPGNLALVLSVEFPTAISVAYVNRNYAPAAEYLGYFDPNKCYTYTSSNNYFQPAALTSNHTCSNQWSGNFLNWATMPTIDPFRWVLTGGYRVVDTSTLTVLEKAWATTQGSFISNFPDSSISNANLAGATPFASYGSMRVRIAGLGNKMRFVLGSSFAYQGNYYNSKDLSGAVALSRTDYDFSSIAGNVAPGTGVNTNNFSARWTASITAPSTGVYSFQTVSDDGVRLYINGTQVINNWTDHGATTDTGTTVSINAGDTINIKLEYYQGFGGATLSLNWQPPGATGYTPVGSSGSGDLGAAPTAFTGSNASSGLTFDLFVRAKVCDAMVGLEQNCVAYSNGSFKPEGLMQQYAKKIRYSAFGYLNDSNLLRDGGVLRAQQAFVGPTKPVPGSPDVSNPTAEWDATTGVFLKNPAPLDASNTSAVMGLPGNSVVDSGVLNYLNKFGEITPGSYKTYDPVSELYYAAIRYYKNLPNVPEWTAVGSASTATKITWTDGFPVITSPADPILYSCQRNFILGIGDINTHADKDLPGNNLTNNEPGVPTTVSADPTNEVDATNRVGVLEGLGSTLGLSNGYGSCCNNNSALIAGAAYEAHVNDIRPDDSSKTNTLGKQTVDTFWVDVLENQAYGNNNQYYLATKYGGFDVPAGYLYSSTTPLPTTSWHTNTDTFGSNLRPDNYFSGGQPERMKAGLETAFKKIVNATGAFTTSFSGALPQVAVNGNASYSTQFDAATWTGEVSASVLDFDPTANTTTLTPKWTFSSKLATQIAGTQWGSKRRVVTWNGMSGVPFRPDQLSPAQQLALNPTYVSSNFTDYLNYLRGDTSHEIDPTATTPSTTKIFRTRSKLIGDIVGSKANPTGPPSFPFSDATNPGYVAFKTTWASRRTVVYVGANDGMLHAINGALDSDVNAGTEMFAYVPSAVIQGPSSPTTPSVDGLASLGNASFAHHYLVNATPNVADVDFARVPNAAGAPQNPSSGSDWRSVLIGGLGKGGKSYYALDVTDPVGIASGNETNAASKVLWEFSNSTPNVKDPGTGRDRLGYTYGDPLVMKTAKYGWVVVLLSGYNGASDGKGYFFFVNPKTGALLEAVPTQSGVGAGVDMGLASGNAFIVDATDGTADAIYAGDLYGNVWRLDVTGTSGTYPAAKLFAQLTAADGTPQPITTRPAIEVDPRTRLRYVLVGTGRLLANTDINSTQGESFYALLDGNNRAFSTKPPPANATFPITRSLLAQSINANAASIVAVNQTTQAGWYEDLGIDTASPSSGIAYRVINDLTTSTGTVSFPSILTNGDVCSPSGSTRVYARNFANAQNTLRFTTNATYSAFGSYAGTATDLHYQSVGGKLRLVLGTDKGGAPLPVPITESVFNTRRLNWRELQVVE